jgi:hypothetical protein
MALIQVQRCGKINWQLAIDNSQGMPEFCALPIAHLPIAHWLVPGFPV